MEVNCINYNPAKLLNNRSDEGKLFLDYLEEEGEKEKLISHIFGLKSYISKCFNDESIVPLRADEVIGNNEMPEEVRAILLGTQGIDLSQYLDKVSSYTAGKTIPNYKGFKDLDIIEPIREEYHPIHYDLFRGVIDNIEVSYLRTTDASTERQFFLAVPNEIESVKDAVGWLCHVPKGLVPHIKTIKRQGEKYVITWDIDTDSEEYKELRNTEMVPLDGDVYFDKLQYEA